MNMQSILESSRAFEASGIFEAGLWIILGYCFVFGIILAKKGSL
jgi:hypothetical protein|tara:strand:+ start:114 stop:245 length:132 start_codon:yes stop_codon:yes gene_type:complete